MYATWSELMIRIIKGLGEVTRGLRKRKEGEEGDMTCTKEMKKE